jgi:hypothetical protein
MGADVWDYLGLDLKFEESHYRSNGAFYVFKFCLSSQN